MEKIKAINIRKTKFGFRVYYENGKTIDFGLEYMDRKEEDF